MSTDAMTTGDWTSAVLNLVQIAAIILGTIWAYYKFVRGRTFHRRAELTIAGSLLESETPTVRAHASMKNTGGSVIPLRAKVLRVTTFSPGDLDTKGRPEWREIAHAPVFQDHDWIESQETIADDVLCPVPNIAADIAAIRVTGLVYEEKKKRWYKRERGDSITWTAKSIIPLVPTHSSNTEDEGANDE